MQGKSLVRRIIQTVNKDKMNVKLRSVLLTLMVLFLGMAQAQMPCDTLSIRFRMDSTRIDMEYADNAQAWDAFQRHFRERYANASPRSLRLDIYSGASPEGPAAHNRWLGETRGIAIRRFVRHHLGDRMGSIVVHNEAARWDGLYEAVAASHEPWRDEVLRIIEMPPTTEEYMRDHREMRLRSLHDGTVWPVLLRDYLAPLRSGATAILSWETGRDTIVVRDTIVMVQSIYVNCDSLRPVAPAVQQGDLRKPRLRQPVWIAKTNLPFLLAGTPNLQVEWSLDHRDKWSFNVEGMWSWWTFSHNDFANEIIYGSVELRRWLGRRWRHHTLSGWHVGLGVGGGYGDLEWEGHGHQAEVYSGFLNIGWQGRSGRRKQWAFDIGVGIGYAYVPWRRYTGSRLFPVGHEEAETDHLMWRETGQSHFVGSPHVNISIGYVFPQKDASWRRARAVARDAERNDYLHFRDSMIAHEKFVKDSIRIARRMRLEEIGLMPKAERKAALAELAAADKAAKREAKAARQTAGSDAKIDRQQLKAEKKRRRQQLRDEKAAHRRQESEIRDWARTPEGRMAVRQVKEEEAAARRQAKAVARAARKQAKAERKKARIKARIDALHQRNLEKLQRDMEKTDNKYNIGGEK